MYAKRHKQQRLWATIDLLGIYPALGALKELAKEDGEKSRVLIKLKAMYKKRHWVFQPRIVELMSELGDTSKVQFIIGQHSKKRYSTYSIQRPDDSAASSNAEDSADRLKKKYGVKKNIK